MAVSAPCNHQPVVETCHTLAGAPADLLNRSHYPIVAVCMFCGKIIRSERYLVAKPPWTVVKPKVTG